MKLIRSYLTNRRKRTKLDTGFIKRTKIFLGVPLRSVLGPLLFDIYINNLFYLAEKTNIWDYADHATFYTCDSDLHNLILRLEHGFNIAID